MPTPNSFDARDTRASGPAPATRPSRAGAEETGRGGTRSLATALSAAELDRALSLFDEDGCFVTPDATAIRGSKGIRAILSQLIASRVQLRVESRSTRMAGSLALCQERWAFTHARAGAAPLVQASDSTALLRRSSDAWRLLIAAPWGIADADRRPFASMPWPR
jgi:uncharacterized protein (TIGR02246 family)